MSEVLTPKQIKTLKGIAQRLNFEVRLGKEGVTEAFIKDFSVTLATKELVKVRFTGHKDEKKEISDQIADKTDSNLITRVGHVAVFYKRNPELKDSIRLK